MAVVISLWSCTIKAKLTSVHRYVQEQVMAAVQ